MSAASHIRRLAFQVLFQLDARGGEDVEHVREGLRVMEGGVDHAASGDGEGAARIDEAVRLAQKAYELRVKADAAVSRVAPTWPVGRQAAVDRAILRLAYHEMASGRTPVAVAIDEAVELAKQYGTEKSPGFVNGVLDAIAKTSLAAVIGGHERAKSGEGRSEAGGVVATQDGGEEKGVERIGEAGGDVGGQSGDDRA